MPCYMIDIGSIPVHLVLQIDAQSEQVPGFSVGDFVRIPAGESCRAAIGVAKVPENYLRVS